MAKFVLYKNEGKIYRLEAELPPSDAYIVFDFDVENPEDLIYDGSQIRLKTQDEKLQELKAQKLSELKTYVASLLAQTDYVITKIAEAQIRNDMEEVEALKQKYSTQLQRREAIRQWNEQMKQAIRNAQNLEELMGIVIEFKG